MKQFSLALNIILLIAVGFLYYLHFAGKKKTPAIANVSTSSDTSTTSFKIAYFDIDSLEANYDFYKQIRQYLQQKEEANVRALTKMQNDMDKRYKELVQKGPSMTQAEQVQAEQEIQQMQKSLQDRQRELVQDFQTEQLRKQRELNNQIKTTLKDYSKERGFVFVFGDQNDYLFYKDTTRNVTSDLIRLLNEKYKVEKEATKKK